MQLSEVYPALAPGYLLDAADAEALAVLYRRHEVGGLEQAVAVARVQPGEAAAEELDPQRPLLQVEAVEVGDLVLAAGGRLQGRGLGRHRVVVEVEAGHGIVALGARGLLLQRDHAARAVELDHAVGTGVLHVVAKDARALPDGGGTPQHGREALAVEQVVAQDEAPGAALQEVGAQHEGLSQPVGPLLHFVRELHAQLLARAQQVAEHGQVPRRGDDQHLADAGQHQRGQGVINHRLVVDGHDLLGDGLA